MPEIRIEVKDGGLSRTLPGYERALERNLDTALQRGALEISREARRRAPKAFSTLTQAIIAYRDGPNLHGVAAGVDYARPVEEGSRPNPGVPIQNLIDWIKVKRIQPRDPSMDIEDLARAIASKIARRGTRSQPFMAPALEDKRQRLHDLVNAAVERTTRELQA